MKKLLTLYSNWKCITMSKYILPIKLSLSQLNPIYTHNAWYILILSFHLRLPPKRYCLFTFTYILSRPTSGVTYKAGVLDWTLHTFDAHISYNLQSTALLLFHTVCSLLHTHPVPLVYRPFTSPLVPAYNGICSPFWVSELSPRHSHSDSWLKVQLLELHTELPPLVSYCSVRSSMQ
jgi:hypothetical protein